MSRASLRAAKGFDEGDAPTTAELARFVGIRVRDGGLAWYGVPTEKAGATQEEGTPLPGEETPAGSGDEAETAPQDGGTGAETGVGPPAGAAIDRYQMRLLGAAEAAVWQCRRTAGSRILGKLPRQECSRFRVVPRHQIYAEAGRAYLAKQNGGTLADPAALVRGGTDAFEHAMRSWGYSPERVERIADLVREHAAATLHESAPTALPPTILNL